MNKFLRVTLLCILVNKCTCPDLIYRIEILNNSTKQVTFAVSKLYPDTILPRIPEEIQTIPPMKTAWFDSSEKWERFFEELPADTLSIFFIDASVYAQFPWDTIIAKNLIIERRDLSLDDIIQNEYSVSYP